MANVYETSDETEVVKTRDGLGNGLVVLTTIALLLAVVLVHQAMKKHFNTGFFGNSKVPVYVAPDATPTPAPAK
jgi:hypothetical protein